MNQTIKRIGLATGVLVMAGGFAPSFTQGISVLSSISVEKAGAASVTYKTTDNLNLRAGTSTGTKAYLTIPKGKTVSHVSVKGSWTQVKYGTKTGWVSTKYLKKDVVAKKAAVKVTALVTSDNLNLRSGASTSSKTLLTIPKGKSVSELARKGSWSQVKYGTKTGWVSNKYLKTPPKPVVKPAPKPVVKPTPKPVTPPVVKPAPTTPEAPKASTSTTIPYEATENLNMRSGSGTSYSILLTIPKGAEVGFVADATTGWAKVVYGGKTGYVSKAYLELVKPKVETVFTQYAINLQDMTSKQYALDGQTDKYRSASAYVSKSLVKAEGTKGTILDNANVRSETNTTSHIYGVLPKNSKVTIVKSYDKFFEISYQAWRNATYSDIQAVLNPSLVKKDSKEYFQFLDLSKSAGVSGTSLNKVLVGKGILEGQGSAFVKASKELNVNEIYLASHAMLETGNGTSTLAKGVLVTQVDGKAVTPRTVYNMYGIGAVDASPLKGGSERAYKEGWFTPEASIIGGAKFIGSMYVNNPTYNQNTLYKMRWNPERPGTHQYATDIGWAVKQVSHIYNLYQQLDDYTLSYDVPVYSK